MYKLVKDYSTSNVVSILRTSDNTFIPFDPGNQDYQEYLEWLAAGNEPEPTDEAPE